MYRRGCPQAGAAVARTTADTDLSVHRLSRSLPPLALSRNMFATVIIIDTCSRLLAGWAVATHSRRADRRRQCTLRGPATACPYRSGDAGLHRNSTSLLAVTAPGGAGCANDRRAAP